MTTQFKDWHLYLGCEMYVFPPDTVGEWLTEALKRTPDLKFTTTLTPERLREIPTMLGHHPILRRTSDMPDEDIKGMPFNQYPNFKDFIFTPAQTAYMLSKSFDLFGLIDSGQAIDATTLPNNPYKK